MLMNRGIQLGGGVEYNNSKDFNKFNSFLKNTKKFIAFTLAETLIVMGIIGVVAALTILNLNGSTNDMEKNAKVKKVYANLTEVFDRATAVYGPIETWFVNDGDDADKKSQRLAERLAEFLKLSKGVSLDTYNEPIFILADGTAVSLSVWEEDEPCTSAPQYI